MLPKSFPRLTVRFYREISGSEPVREWLKSLSRDEKREIGTDIKTVQFGWPMGMPTVGHIEKDIWEVRSRLRHELVACCSRSKARRSSCCTGLSRRIARRPRPTWTWRGSV